MGEVDITLIATEPGVARSIFSPPPGWAGDEASYTQWLRGVCVAMETRQEFILAARVWREERSRLRFSGPYCQAAERAIVAVANRKSRKKPV
jgi:hypothetical protein